MEKKTRNQKIFRGLNIIGVAVLLVYVFWIGWKQENPTCEDTGQVIDYQELTGKWRVKSSERTGIPSGTLLYVVAENNRLPAHFEWEFADGKKVQRAADRFDDRGLELTEMPDQDADIEETFCIQLLNLPEQPQQLWLTQLNHKKFSEPLIKLVRVE